MDGLDKLYCIGLALKAIDIHHGVPYLKELSGDEHFGLIFLEELGYVHADHSGIALHWHVKRPVNT